MNEPPLGSEEVAEFSEAGWEWSFLDTSSGEKLVWSGRPVAYGPLIRDALRQALVGLLFVAFTVVWMACVVQGGNNNWDQGKVVEPFAPHNVRIAAFAGLWMLPPGFWMLTWPLRAWWKARSTRYLLTNRRAIICEPRFRGGFTLSSYAREALVLMRCEEFRDGIGSLVFEDKPTSSHLRSPIGFRAIANVREVERQVRTLAANELRTTRMNDSPNRLAPIAALPKSYTLGLVGRLQCMLAWAICLFVILSMTAVALTAPVVFLLIEGPPAGVQRGFVEGPLALLAGCVAILVCAVGAGVMLRRAIRGTIVTITINEEQEVELSSWFGTTALRVPDLVAIQAGSRLDFGRAGLFLRHKGGRQFLINQFVNFRDFLVTIKALNPSVEIKGF